MSVGIGRISKGLFQRSIEKVANNINLRSDFLDTLEGNPLTAGEDWIDFLGKHGGLDKVSENYIRNEWLQFWQEYDLRYKPEIIEEMLRQSLIKAIRLAMEHKPDAKELLPIDCQWIWTDGNKKFEVLVTYNEQQVTRILLTPRPPTAPILPLRFRAPYFTVKLSDDINETEEPEQPGPSGPSVYTGDPQVVTAQLKSVR